MTKNNNSNLNIGSQEDNDLKEYLSDNDVNDSSSEDLHNFDLSDDDFDLSNENFKDKEQDIFSRLKEIEEDCDEVETEIIRCNTKIESFINTKSMIEELYNKIGEQKSGEIIDQIDNIVNQYLNIHEIPETEKDTLYKIVDNNENHIELIKKYLTSILYCKFWLEDIDVHKKVEEIDNLQIEENLMQYEIYKKIIFNIKNITQELKKEEEKLKELTVKKAELEILAQKERKKIIDKNGSFFKVAIVKAAFSVTSLMFSLFKPVISFTAFVLDIISPVLTKFNGMLPIKLANNLAKLGNHFRVNIGTAFLPYIAFPIMGAAAKQVFNYFTSRHVSFSEFLIDTAINSAGIFLGIAAASFILPVASTSLAFTLTSTLFSTGIGSLAHYCGKSKMVDLTEKCGEYLIISPCNKIAGYFTNKVSDNDQTARSK